MKSIFKQIIVWSVSVTLSAMPLAAYPNTQAETGREGQVLGKSILADLLANKPTQTANGFAVKDPNTGDTFTFNSKDLYPGAQDGATGYFTDNGTVADADLQASFEDSSQMSAYGSASKKGLYADAMSGTPSVSGAAYKVLLDASNRSRQDFRNDPMMNQTNETLTGMDSLVSQFGDCSVNTNFKETSRLTHIPDYKTCKKLVDKSSSCKVTHQYEASLIAHHNGPYNIKSCGVGCMELWIGKVGDNYWSGDCTVFEETSSYIVSNPDAIISAKLEYAKWDDYMQVFVGGAKVWQSSTNFPPESGGRCELETSFDGNPGTDVTNHFKNAGVGGVVDFKIRVSVSGEGEGYGRIILRFDPKKTVTKDDWAPEDCIEPATAVKDGFATGTVTCESDPRGSDGCVITNGITLCEDALSPAPIPDTTNLCKSFSVLSDYRYYKDAKIPCFTDLNGNEQCWELGNADLDTCEELAADPQCGFVSSDCAEGGSGKSGTCYVHSDVYDCGESAEVPSITKEEDISCGGPIKCMGDECLDVTKTQSQDFAKATALLNTAQFLTQDMKCTGMDDGDITGNENVTCEAFAGESSECKVAVGGIQNCCDTPVTASMYDYLSMLKAANKLTTAIGQIDSPYLNAAKGAYQAIGESAGQTWSEISKPFASYVENIGGTVGKVVDSVQGFSDAIKKAIKEALEKVMNSIMEKLGYEGGSAAAQGTLSTAMETLMDSPAMEMLGNVMMVYGYVMLAIAVIKLIFKCEEEEFVLNSKRKLKSCHVVGSYCNSSILGVCTETRDVYCCFSSPLSRIVQEQVRNQTGLSWGTAKAPNCSGIPMDKLANVDWNSINLDEWIGILADNGHLGENFSLESLTGSGSALNINGTRGTAAERAIDRVGTSDIDGVRNSITEQLSHGVDKGQP